MKDYHVRKADLSDAWPIWKIRNHALIRRVSGNREKIGFAEHQAWFKNKYFAKSDNYCFVIELGKLVIGYCRFDYDEEEKCFNVSIAIKYGQQGRGYGNVLLDRAIKKMKDKEEMTAKIKKDNLHSLRLFQKNNFAIVGGDDVFHYLKYKA